MVNRALLRFALALLVVSYCRSAWCAPTADAIAERHIQNIERDLLPPVLVANERRARTNLQERMAVLHIPGVSIAVIHHGKIAWARGFGVSSIGGAPITTGTLFQAASISKPVAALGVLELVQQRKLDLDANVNEYLKSWKLPENEFTAQHLVTIRELLTHTAGVTVHGFLGYAAGETLPTLEQILDGLPPANSFAIRVDIVPGTQWRYSGGGYVVLQQLMEDMTGTSFERYMSDKVLGPLKMNSSTYALLSPDDVKARAALPYSRDGSPVIGGAHRYPEQAPAGLWTTPTDLAKYIIEVQGSLHGGAHHLLSPAMTHQMLTAVKSNQGMGPQVGGAEGRRWFSHDGANEGYRCFFVGFNEGDGAVVMTNSDRGSELQADLIRTIAHEYGWREFEPTSHRLATVNPARFDGLVGSYRINPDFAMTVWRDGDHLYSQAFGYAPDELFPESDRTYFTREFDSQLSFVLDSGGRATSFNKRQDGHDEQAVRMDDASARPLETALSVIHRRIKEQRPDSRSEATLRELISSASTGILDYGKFSPELAGAIKANLPNIQEAFQAFGELQALHYENTSADGTDTFKGAFKNGDAQFTVMFGLDGRVVRADFRPEN